VDIDKIVDKIVEEVLKRAIDVEAKEADLKLNGEIRKAHRCCKKELLIAERPDSSRFKEICSQIDGNEYEVYSLKDYHGGKKDYSIIIIGSLLNRELANLSVGVQCGAIENIVIPALFNGERVILLEEGIEYRDYKNTLNENLYGVYENHERTILSFGIELTTLVALKANLGDCYEEIVIKEAPNGLRCDCSMLVNKSIEFEDLTNKKVITESEIRRVLGRSKKQIRVNNKAIITPLCRDFLKKYNIVVEVM